MANAEPLLSHSPSETMCPFPHRNSGDGSQEGPLCQRPGHRWVRHASSLRVGGLGAPFPRWYLVPRSLLCHLKAGLWLLFSISGLLTLEVGYFSTTLGGGGAP